MRPLLALLVLALDFWAIVSVLGADRPGRNRGLWVLAIVGLPLVGALAWLVVRRQRPHPGG